MKLGYTIPRKGDNAMINRDIDRALVGSGMRREVSTMTNRARNNYTRRAPRHLIGATSVGIERRKDRLIGTVHVSHPSALAIEFGAPRRGRPGRHIMRQVAEELNN